MSVNLKKDQKNGIAKPQMPNVMAPIVKPQPEKATEPVKPSLDERIQRIEELRSLTTKRQSTSIHYIICAGSPLPAMKTASWYYWTARTTGLKPIIPT